MIKDEEVHKNILFKGDIVNSYRERSSTVEHLVSMFGHHIKINFQSEDDFFIINKSKLPLFTSVQQKWQQHKVKPVIVSKESSIYFILNGENEKRLYKFNPRNKTSESKKINNTPVGFMKIYSPDVTDKFQYILKTDNLSCEVIDKKLKDNKVDCFDELSGNNAGGYLDIYGFEGLLVGVAARNLRTHNIGNEFARDKEKMGVLEKIIDEHTLGDVGADINGNIVYAKLKN